MSTPFSSFNILRKQQFMSKRNVPDGSNDFQKVLDEIFFEDLADQESRERGNDKFVSDGCVEEVLLDQVKDIKIQENGKGPMKCKLNNFVGEQGDDNCAIKEIAHLPDDHKHNTGCEQKTERTISKNGIIQKTDTQSSIQIFDCRGDLIYNSDIENKTHNDNLKAHLSKPELCMKLPSVNSADNLNDIASKMGANCSTGLYDHNDWHSIVTKESVGESGKISKKSKLSNKKLTKENYSKDNNGNGVISAQLCTCKHRISDCSPESSSSPINIVSKDKSPTDSEKSTPDSRSSSPSQSRLSRILGLKKSSSAPKADVSPHRLLVRRVHSPKTRASSMEEMIRQNNDSVYRQRSQSWSNGKLSPRPISPRPHSTFIQSPILSPVSHHRDLVVTRHSPSPCSSPRPGNRDKLLPDINNKTQLVTNSLHDEGCPLYNPPRSPDSDDLSNEDDFDDVTPMSRRRAVSESQTLRTKQKARRAASRAASQAAQDDDHLHVHWADEKRGSALSTSVFLSSIRPRSYSHGAECNTPQRPILKKVIIS